MMRVEAAVFDGDDGVEERVGHLVDRHIVLALVHALSDRITKEDETVRRKREKRKSRLIFFMMAKASSLKYIRLYYKLYCPFLEYISQNSNYIISLEDKSPKSIA